MANDAAAVRTLLKEAADVNAAQGDGMTALHWAARHGNHELTQMLLYAGANTRATTRINAYTPLFFAAKYGHTAVVEALVKDGADPNARSSTGSTPLMIAAASGSVDAVKLLLDAGAEINAQESARSLTALMYAAAYNRGPVITLLGQRKVDLDATTKVVDLYARTRADELAAAAGKKPPQPQVPGVDRGYQYRELIGYEGGRTALILAARQGHVEAVKALLEAGANINKVSDGDKTSPLLVATINGHFDLAKYLLDRGADPTLTSENGATPLYAVVNCQWAPKADYPQPRAHLQQQITYLELMKAFLDKGADPNLRVSKKVWYSGYNADRSGVDEIGATPFWRAAYASDVAAMRLLVDHGADPNIPTVRPVERTRVLDPAREDAKDVSGLPPVPVGGASVTALLAAAGVGYGDGFAANSHRFAPIGMMAAVKYLVEELQADVNARDHEGNSVLHHAAARGDVEMILYLVSKGADVSALNRKGQTTADMANGPVQRIQPFPEAVALLVKLGARNNNKCVSC
jgi:ankyrin repeat protein